jgi:2-iminobutanoate/2-iminopropanoate deaminase
MARLVTPINVPEIGGSFSHTTAHGAKANGFVFVTGQVANPPGLDPKETLNTGELGTIEDQAVRTLENIKAILKAAGTSFENVVERRIFLVNPLDWAPLDKIMSKYFSPVASTTICVNLVPYSARVEITVVAAVPN